ncbi:Uncharacterised protein [Streptococcus pneumoniae]|nr:Uncharacterised protein [Streptococcus pneumoniae]
MLKLHCLLSDNSSSGFLNIVILRIVDIDLNLGKCVKDFLTDIIDKIRKGTIKLFDRDVHGLVCLGSDDIHHRLGLCQIYATV